MKRFPHLDLETAVLADRPPEERMAHVLTYRFCNYPASDLVLDKLDILFYDEAPGRQLGLAVFGKPGLGKSHILQHFATNLHGPFTLRERGTEVRPVAYVALAPEFTVKELQEHVLDALGVSTHGYQGNRDLYIKRLARSLGVRTFVFDDIQHFLNQTPTRGDKLFDWVKFLLNRLEIPVVICGLPDAAAALQANSQLASRFETLTLPPWEVGEALAQFLGNFERTFPLRSPSYLGSPEMQEQVLLAGGGVARIFTRHLLDAALYAIDQGIECIDSSLLAVRMTRPRELVAAYKRALVAHRRMSLGESVALEHFPELPASAPDPQPNTDP